MVMIHAATSGRAFDFATFFLSLSWWKAIASIFIDFTLLLALIIGLAIAWCHGVPVSCSGESGLQPVRN